jgi:predicted permease
MTWWQRLWRRRQLEEQLEKELRFHLDRHAADLMARGLDRSEARRKAAIALGGAEQVKEQCRDARGTRWLEDLWQDFRYALRTLRQRPGFAGVALVTLALGIGATTVMFTVIDGVLLKPLAYPEPERLVTLHGVLEKFGEFWGFSYLDFLDCKRDSRSLDIAAWTWSGGTVSSPGEPEYADGRVISAGLFSVLGVAPVAGRAFQAEEDKPGGPLVAIISYGFWQRRFGGGRRAIGARFLYDGRPYTIVGVAPPGFHLAGEADVLTPLGQQTEPRMWIRGAHFIHVVARLRPGVALAQAQAEVELIGRNLARQYPDSDVGLGLLTKPLGEELVQDVRSTLWLLLWAVGLVLLIACANIASLLLARAVSRGRELAMRVALGAGRGRLARQCLTESVLLGMGGGLLGVLLAVVGVRPFIAFWPGVLPRAEEVHVDWRVLLFALAASVACGILFGLAPAFRVPVDALENALRAGSRSVAASSRRLHSAFVAGEIALAVVLLVAAGMLGRTLLRLSALDPGVNVHHVLAARFALSPAVLTDPGRIRAAWQDVLDRARRVPGIESVALADIIPMREGENSLPYSASPEPPPMNQMPIALATCAAPDYLRVMGIPLKRGRFFDEHDRMGSEMVVVVDDNLAQHAFGTTDIVGKRLWTPALGTTSLRIIGVVGHVRHWGLAGDDQSRVRDQLYYAFAQVPDPLLRFFSSVMSIAVRTSIQPLDVVEPLRGELRGAGGDQVLYEVRTMEQLAHASLDRQRFLVLLFGIFAGLALLLASIGIYGVLAYLTNQRVPEFGVRIALGAAPRDVIRMVLGESLQVIASGLGFGLCGAWAAGRLMERLVAGIEPPEAATYAAMVGILIAAAFAASFLPARHASRTDPMQALRQE